MLILGKAPDSLSRLLNALNFAPKFHLARHVTSRRDTLPSTYILALGKVVTRRDEKCRDVSCLSDSTARHASHDTCSAASPQRGLGWTCPPHFFQKLCMRFMQKSRAQKTKPVHASTTASSSSAMLEQARLDTLDTLYVSCRDVT